MGEVYWRDLPGLAGRSAPVVIDSIEQIQSLPLARDLEKVKTEFGISGLFCVQEVPQIFFIEQQFEDVEEIRTIQNVLWNQGLARLLVVVSPDVVRVFSIARKVETDDAIEFKKRCLIESIQVATELNSFERIVHGVESGRLWQDQALYFDPRAREENHRIDSVLLDNLKNSQVRLTAEKLKPVQAQAALIQTMFIAYLEDRGIIDAKYLEQSTKAKHSTFSSILQSGDDRSFSQLFSRLQKDFNGDLFIAPCSFTDSDVEVQLTPRILDVLEQFRSGKLEMKSGQYRLQFCNYDFRYIPIVLISEVYDSFLSQNRKQQKSGGAYYTPTFLVDTILSNIWRDLKNETKEQGIFLDPACGSGVFLVRCFQHLCQHENVKKEEDSWKNLKKIVSRIKGCDVDEIAVRVAVFSLYLAMLEMESIPNIDQLMKNGQLLPPLLGRTIRHIDYFKDETEHVAADVILGNPPWTTEDSAVKTAEVWSKGKNFPMPDRQLAWAFVWKAKSDLTNNGKIAFLLPAKSFLHNTSSVSFEARKKLFNESCIGKVINFSDIRFQLFKNSKYPAALIVMDKSDEELQDYEIEYWVPKSDLNVQIKQFITLSSVDKNHLLLSDVVNIPTIFSQQFWMSLPESRLFSYLCMFPRIEKFVMRYRSTSKPSEKTSTDWVMGSGFAPISPNLDNTRNSAGSESKNVGSLKRLGSGFSTLAVSNKDLLEPQTKLVQRKGFERAFLNPRILIARGIRSNSNRLTVSYSETPLTFSNRVYAICFPELQTESAKFLVAVLNSKLAMWYMFHTSSSIATSRKELHSSEILNFPFPEPNDFPKKFRTEKKELREKLVDIVDQVLTYKKQDRESTIKDALRIIDELTYKYFGLSETEIVLIEDTVKYTLKSVQPGQNAKLELISADEKPIREQYAKQLAMRLSNGLQTENEGISVELMAHNEDFGIVKITYGELSSVKPYKEFSKSDFDKTLNRIHGQTENYFQDKNFQTIPDYRIFDENCIYLIKPMQKRFWLCSSAIDDASKIRNDIRDFEFKQIREQLNGS